MKKNALTAVFLSVLLIIFSVPRARAGDLRPAGDADGDGALTAADARLTLRAAVGLETLPAADLVYADVVPDGLLTAEDARLILRAAVGLESLPAPEAPPVSAQDDPAQQRRALAAALAEEVRADALEADMRFLTEELGVRSWWDGTQNAAAERLFTRLQSLGFAEGCLQKLSFTRDGVRGVNLLGVLPAAQDADIFVFCAHYDTARYTPGAVDNASGVAALTELARVLLGCGESFGAEVRFLFTAGEEQGYYGAQSYVESLSSAELQRHRFVFNLDMAGCPAGGEYVLTVCTEPISTGGYTAPAAASNAGSRALEKANELCGGLPSEAFLSPVRAGKHDIVPFRKAGVPSLTLSWRCFDAERCEGADLGLAVPAITHARDDDYTHFDMPSLIKTARLAVCAAVLLPAAEKTPGIG